MIYKQVLKLRADGKYEVVAQFSDNLSLAEFADHEAVKRDWPESAGFKYSAIQRQGGAIGAGNVITLGADGPDGFPVVGKVEAPDPPKVDAAAEARKARRAELKTKLQAGTATQAEVAEALSLLL